MTMLLQKPQLVVRVGITGHRKLGDDPQVQQAISAALIRVFETLQSQVNILHQTDQGQGDLSLYDDKLPTLRLISGLAAGADQLAAHAALNQGWQLEAVLPFTVDEFRKDFGTPAEPTRFGEAFGLPGGDDLAAFEALLAKAGPACIELCGPAKPAELRNRSYLAVGQGIVRRCEVLVAVWDGCEAAGKGGSADVVEHALRNHVPVIWIPTEGQNQSFWLDSTEDYYAVLLDRRDSLSPLTDDTLCRYLKHQLLVEFNEKKKPGLYDQPYTLAQFREDIDRHCQNPVCKPVFGYGFFQKTPGLDFRTCSWLREE